jgi:chromosome partitioning protein
MVCSVITVTQQKGGAGKTTLAIHLAVALSQQGKRVAAIDIDPQGSFTHWHKIRENLLGEGYTGLHFVAVPGWRVATEVSRLAREYDVIVIDSPPHTETESKTAIRVAHLAVIPVQPSPTDVWATNATLDLAKREHIPALLVFNRVSSQSKLAKEFAGQLGPNLLSNYLGNRVAFASCLLEGRTVTETEPTSVAAKEMKLVVADIWRQLHPESAVKLIEEEVLA